MFNRRVLDQDMLDSNVYVFDDKQHLYLDNTTITLARFFFRCPYSLVEEKDIQCLLLNQLYLSF